MCLFIDEMYEISQSHEAHVEMPGTRAHVEITGTGLPSLFGDAACILAGAKQAAQLPVHADCKLEAVHVREHGEGGNCAYRTPLSE